jgi:MFS family permease
MTGSPAPGRWQAAVAIVSLFFAYVFVQRVAPGVMVGDLMRDFDAGGAVLGNLSAFYFYSYASLQIVVGAMMDRVGPRRLITFAAIVCGAGSLLFSVADSLPLAYAGRLMVGIGAAFSFVGALTVIHQTCPPGKFSFLSGIVQAAGMAGALLGQAPLGLWVEASGWREPLFTGGLLAAGIGLAAWLVLRDRARDGRAMAKPDGSMFAGFGSVVRNPQTWLAAAVGGCLTAPMLAFGGLWGVPFLQSAYGFDRAGAAAFTGALFIGWAVGAPVTGWLSDRVGRRRPILIVGSAVMTLSLVTVIFVSPLPGWLLALLLFINGAGSSTMILTFTAARAANSPETTGLALGIVNTCVVGSGAIAQPLLGMILDLNWDGTLLEGARVYAPDAFGLAFLPVMVSGIAGGLAASRLLPVSAVR